MWKKGKIKDDSKGFRLRNKVPFTEMRKSGRGTIRGAIESFTKDLLNWRPLVENQMISRAEDIGLC